jgi:hypothetical protein
MGTSLASATPSASFDSLIKFGDNDGVTSGLKQLSDGMGNNLPIYISSTTTTVTGSLYGSSSYAATSSYVLNSISSSYAITASYVQNAVSSSYAVTASYVKTSQTASLALTASYILYRNVPEYNDNNDAINNGGLPIGAVYRQSGQDFLMIVH